MLDRHFLGDIESKLRIADIDDEEEDTGGDGSDDQREHHIFASPVDGLRVVLARKFENTLDFRQLPVSLSRLYFSGKRTFVRAIHSLSNWQLDTLTALADADHFQEPIVVSASTSNDDTFCDPSYSVKCDRAGEYLRQVIDLCLLSFETCLTRTIEALTNGTWRSAGLFVDLHTLDHWRELPGPHATWRTRSCDDDDAHPLTLARRCVASRHAIWLVVLWRCNVTLLLERVLQPWRANYERDWLQYRLKLFRDTHLDLMTLMVQRGDYDDASLQRTGALASVYPAAQRVCCAEELPDLIRFSTDNFKTGANLKERNTLDEKFGHIFINKTSPNICKIRNLFDISIRYGEQSPIIYETLKNVLRCVLLGNLPRSQGAPSALARIKINASFQPAEADRVISEEVFTEMSKNKSLKRRRNQQDNKKKKGGEEEEDTVTCAEDDDDEEADDDDTSESLGDLTFRKTQFILWFLLCRHLVMFLLKEFLCYIAESSGCFDQLSSENYKGLRWKEIVRLGNGRCRALLSASARADRPFDWHAIEYEEKQKKVAGAGDVKSGEIKKFHQWTLKSTMKIKKDEFLKIIMKKMTAREKHMPLARIEECEPFYALTEEEARRRRVLTLDQVHFLCWYMALNRTPILETRLFQLMGMSLYGLAQLRNWLFCYYTYEIADNSFITEIDAVWRHSMRDHFILKSVGCLIPYYRAKLHVYHLSLQQAKRQMYALRTTLNIGDYETTPLELGRVYQCRACLKFANVIVTNATSSNGENGKTAKEEAVAEQQSCSFLNKTLYNAETGRLHCMKYANPYTRQRIDENGVLRTIMRSRDGSIVVESTKAAIVDSTAPIVINPPPSSSSVASNTRGGGGVGRGRVFYNARQIREQNERKLDWLMQTSAYDVLQAAVTTPTGTPTTLDEEATTTAKKKQQGEARDAKKKLIQKRMNDLMVQQGITCQGELMPTDMIGIVKNGKVLCVVCGLMTEARNDTLSSDGAFTCGRHREWCQASASSPAPPTVVTSGKTAMFHPVDVIGREQTNDLTCHFCPSKQPRVRLTVIGDLLAIVKIPLCRDCLHKCKQYRSELTPLRVINTRMGVK